MSGGFLVMSVLPFCILEPQESNKRVKVGKYCCIVVRGNLIIKQLPIPQYLVTYRYCCDGKFTQTQIYV